MSAGSLATEFAAAVENMRRGNLPDAERACRRIVSSAPDHFGAQYMLGVICLRQGQIAAADRFLSTAVQLNPGIPSAHRDRGIALAQLARTDEALLSFDRALALKPDSSDVHGLR